MKRFTLSRFSRIEALPWYQPVLGTVAYDDVNKRMNVITTTGANGKASGRLKSYKFCEGAQQFDVTLPVGDSGDFICLVTHSANELMTDGIGVGLQSDGAGNWNLATLSRTTVTVGAPSGLTDGMTARIEIEKDITGAYWYYIYDAAGAKPTTATGKLFTALSEGYTGWYANGNSKTYAIDNISIRAESIVGRTNVEVTEPFWFRDDFGEDSRGRYVTAYGSIAGGKITISDYRFYCTLPQIISGSASVETKVIDWVSSTWASINLFSQVKSGTKIRSGYKLETIYTGVRLWKDNEIIQSVDNVVTGLTEVTLRLEFDSVTNTVTGYVNGDTVITYVDEAPYTSGYACLDTYSVTNPIGFDYFEVSGTRVYQKPIHRGAMLETYHDGTQEVVGTTFIDDCQWDRRAEYTLQNGTATYDATNGYYTIATTSAHYGVQELNGVRVTEGIIGVEINREELIYGGLLVSWDGTLTLGDSSNKIPNNGLAVYIAPFGVATDLFINGAWTASIAAFTPSGWHKLQVNIIGTTANIYVDGVLLKTITNAIISAYDHVGVIGYKASAGNATKWRNLQIIAASSDATNGIAACIPPIGGGARYGEQEEVYFNIQNAVKHGEYAALLCAKSTTPSVIEMTTQNITDSTSIRPDRVISEEVATTENYNNHVVHIVTTYQDRNDIIKVSAKNKNASNIYVETLAITPIYEVI